MKDGILSEVTPLVVLSCLITFADMHKASIGCLGLYFATSLAVAPFSVITIMRLAF